MLTLQEFGATLKNFRKQNGLTQGQLAEKTKLAQNTISQWENGLMNPGFMEVAAIAEHFNLSLDQLFLKKKNEN